MERQPRHRPRRSFPNAKRIIVDCELNECIHCGSPLSPRRPWHMKKTVQTMNGPVFVAGKSKECANPQCTHYGTHYYASRTLLISLPYSTYGLDVLAFIGWQHEHEHRQLVEIQQGLNQRRILINERNVGKLYRQFLALLGGLNEQVEQRLADTAAEHGGLIWAIDALQPEGHGSLLYVLYEVLGETPVAAIQSKQATEAQLKEWLKPYQALPFPVLATLSDGEKAAVAALKGCWPGAPHQRCQTHFLNNLAEPVLDVDTQLRKRMREDLGGLPKVPDRTEGANVPGSDGQPMAAPPLLPAVGLPRDAELMETEAQIRTAIRDAVNRPSRKPFYWGGLVGYGQLGAIAEALHSVPDTEPETGYLQRLTTQIDRALEKNRVLAQDLSEAHAWLKRIAACLRYPPRSFSVSNTTVEIAQSAGTPLSSQQVQREMKELLQQFQPDLKRRPAQTALYHAWHRLWETVGADLLYCYDIPGLPPDNLKMEGLFGRLRRHQRRISGRKSTRELRDFGQYQVLFAAESEEELLQQLRQVPVATYQAHRRRLAEAEASRQFLHRLHRDPVDMMRRLIDQHTARRASLGFNAANKSPPVHNN